MTLTTIKMNFLRGDTAWVPRRTKQPRTECPTCGNIRYGNYLDQPYRPEQRTIVGIDVYFSEHFPAGWIHYDSKQGSSCEDDVFANEADCQVRCDELNAEQEETDG